MASDRILVTGGTGFLGRPLARELRGRGRSVRISARRAPPDIEGMEFSPADLERETDWSAALQDVEAIVHTAARAHVLREASRDPLALFRLINRDATLELARQAAAAGVRRFVFISSIGVNGSETRERPFRADDPSAPHSPYAVSKHEAELGLAEISRETELEVVVIRPPLIIGPNPKGNLAALDRMIDNGVPLPFRQVTGNRRDLVSLQTLIDLIIVCVDHSAAAGQTFVVSDGRPLSTRGVLEALARQGERRLRLFSVPPFILSALLSALGRKDMAAQLLGNLEVDIAPTRHRLDWKPPV